MPNALILLKLITMKIQCWSIGKNNESYIKEGVEDFTRRISKYFPVEWNLIPTPKNAGMLSEMDLKKKEGETILEWLKKDDYLVVLDERGKSLTSPQLAEFIQRHAASRAGGCGASRGPVSRRSWRRDCSGG